MSGNESVKTHREKSRELQLNEREMWENGSFVEPGRVGPRAGLDKKRGVWAESKLAKPGHLINWALIYSINFNPFPELKLSGPRHH